MPKTRKEQNSNYDKLYEKLYQNNRYGILFENIPSKIQLAFQFSTRNYGFTFLGKQDVNTMVEK